MKCFYHSADFDGKCSAGIVKYKYPECELIGINYGDEFPWDTIGEDETVYMVDFSLQPFSDMQRLNEMCVLHWIDHHQTAIDAANNVAFKAHGGSWLDSNYAACELTWMYCKATNPQLSLITHSTLYTIPTAVKLLGRYDVWDHADPRVLPFQYGLRQRKDTEPDSPLWAELFVNGGSFRFDGILEIGEIILNYETAQNEMICKSGAFETCFDGHFVICLNRGMCNSKVFESVYDIDKHALMISFSRVKGTWRVSLRTERHDINCGELAKRYGGGGHRKAAGFSCEVLPFDI